MQGFYSSEQYGYEVEFLMSSEGMSRSDAQAAVDAMEKQDYEEFAQWRQEQDEIADMEERALQEQDAGINDSWYEDQYDNLDF